VIDDLGFGEKVFVHSSSRRLGTCAHPRSENRLSGCHPFLREHGGNTDSHLHHDGS
jgi:hypothetical protein